jgi:hypothetical protein
MKNIMMLNKVQVSRAPSYLLIPSIPLTLLYYSLTNLFLLRTPSSNSYTPFLLFSFLPLFAVCAVRFSPSVITVIPATLKKDMHKKKGEKEALEERLGV